jgi:mRNA-degrading endonuclease RelE of RelBE toxin-antitoxin system
MVVKFKEIERTDPFLQDYDELPQETQSRVDKAIQLLFENLSHPSLHAKKIQGVSDIWEARVTDAYRLTFEIAEGGILRLRRVGTHDILKHP